LRQRIEELERRATRTTREIRFDGGRIVENAEADRLQIFFDSVPSQEIRNQLKARGFRWSPREGAWQRQLTDNARIAASSILGVDLRGSDRPRIGERRVDYGATSFADQLQAFARDVRERHGRRLVDLFEDSNGNIVLDMIAVPRDRQGQGVGTAAMRDLIAFADRHGRRITLKLGQRDPEFGTTSRSRLERFYRRFGFVPNKGRKKDYSISADMYRDPLGSPRVREQAERPRIGESRATYGRDITESPEFRRWFGNSKVVDEHGRPLVVYHGTTAEFDAFERRSADLGFHAGSPEAANAIFESKSDGIRPRPAPLEGRRIMPLYMRIENPLRVRDLDTFSFLTLGPELER